ncbi:MAG: ATP-binding cassette domain-containing protein [Anaplasmataceae bacterium]|nr:ATP-binding cassette domain-containing protein [Anaplasmataceae bacterium]
MNNNSYININNISIYLNNKHIIENLSLDIKKGENIIIMGDSGSGKSLLIKGIMGLQPLSNGAIKINNSIISDNPGKNAKLFKITMLFQHGGLFDSLSVWENIMFYQLFFDNISTLDAKNKAISLLQQVQLKEDIIDRSICDLSGGMQRRVGIARILAMNGNLLLLDEPDAGLDAINTANIGEIILERKKNNENLTFITVTHNIKLAQIISDRLIIMHNGKIAFDGKINELSSSNNEYVQKMANLF